MYFVLQFCIFSQRTNNDSTAQTAAEGAAHIRIAMWANTPSNDVVSDSNQRYKVILDIAVSMTLLLDFAQQQQVLFYSSKQEPKLLVSDSKA